MLSNRLAFGALAIACIAAAGGGGYLATRQANVSTEASAVAPASADVMIATPSTAAPAEASTPLPESTLVAPAPATAAAPETTPRQAARRETPRGRPEPTRAAASTRQASSTSQDSRLDARQSAQPEHTSTATDAPAASTQADTRHLTPDSVAATDALPSAPVNPATAANSGDRDNPVNPVNPVSFEELVVSADSVIGLELDRGVTSDRARVEDEVEARVVRDVRVGRQVAIPAGARALGSVMVVERGGKFKERARLGIRFHTLVLGDGSRLPIQTDTIYRYGAERGDSSARKIGGGAVAGAILGAIIGGAKGAAVGATAGAGGGTAMVMAGERSAAEFQSGAEVTARIMSPVTVTIER